MNIPPKIPRFTPFQLAGSPPGSPEGLVASDVKGPDADGISELVPEAVNEVDEASRRLDQAHVQALHAGINQGTLLVLDPEISPKGEAFTAFAQSMGRAPETIGPADRRAISEALSVELGKAKATTPSVDIAQGKGPLFAAMSKVLNPPAA